MITDTFLNLERQATELHVQHNPIFVENVLFCTQWGKKAWQCSAMQMLPGEKQSFQRSYAFLSEYPHIPPANLMQWAELSLKAYFKKFYFSTDESTGLSRLGALLYTHVQPLTLFQAQLRGHLNWGAEKKPHYGLQPPPSLHQLKRLHLR